MKKFTPKVPTEQNVYEAALRYLERYASSAENLKRVLERRILRYEMRSRDKAPDNVAQWIATAVLKCKAAGFVNDDLYAEQRVAALRRQGRSRHYIVQALALKGIRKDDVMRFLGSNDEAELEAARRYVRRRNLGKKTDPESRQKDLAKLARAGFSMDMARRALDRSE